MPEAEIGLSVRDAVAWITIDNPAKHNAMTASMWRLLGSRVSELSPDVRCVVLRGAGERAFVSGADISEFSEQRRSPRDVAAYEDTAERTMERLQSLAVPTVAMISGYCFGGGVALALCCDVRIASENASFSVPAARLGLGYSWKGIERLLHAVSVPVATDMMISARRYNAHEALAVGLVNRLHSPDELTREVEVYAATVAGNAPLTVRAVKRTIREFSGRSPPDLPLCEHLIAECNASSDYHEGTAAFMEKRSPRFQGR